MVLNAFTIPDRYYGHFYKQDECLNCLRKHSKKGSYFLIEEHFVEALTLSSNEEEFSRLAESLETCGLIVIRKEIVMYTELAKTIISDKSDEDEAKGKLFERFSFLYSNDI